MPYRERAEHKPEDFLDAAVGHKARHHSADKRSGTGGNNSGGQSIHRLPPIVKTSAVEIR